MDWTIESKDLDVGGGTPSEADLMISGAAPSTAGAVTQSELSLTKHVEALHKLKLDDHALDYQLKKQIGTFSRCAVIAQLVVTNLGFIAYFACMTWGLHREIPAQVMIAWLSTTTIEIIGIVLVVTKYLFPDSGNNWNHERH
ncbi:MAG: hypothetical protein GX610_13015 [Rhodococcus sp.]|nr:hypothetical protein [Rhodococcus sp. (in: high G+C Gram-positive bacteria)]